MRHFRRIHKAQEMVPIVFHGKKQIWRHGMGGAASVHGSVEP